MRKFDLSLRSSRSSYFATFRHQLTILSKTDALDRKSGSAGMPRSEERFSRNAETDLVCRLLLEKKKAHVRPLDPEMLQQRHSVFGEHPRRGRQVHLVAAAISAVVRDDKLHIALR